MFKRQRIVLVLGVSFFITSFTQVSFADTEAGYNFYKQFNKGPSEGTKKPKPCVKSAWKGVDEVSGFISRGVDGDTARVNIDGVDMPIRMLSIDTPETNFQGKSQGKWAELAKEKLQGLLPVNTKVSVQLEDEKCDANGRMLGHIWRGNKNINRAMVESALATMYCIYPNDTYCQEYGAITQKAYEAQEGMFGDKSMILPYEWRRMIRKEPRSKYVGNLETLQVLKPEYLDEIEVGDRIFFMEISDVVDPYSVVDSL